MTEVIAIANRKGGSGKTTTAVALAVEWARRGRRTLLIDFDSQGHAGLGLGLREADDPTRTCHHLFRAPDTPLEALCRPVGIPNLMLCPADRDFSGDLTGPPDPYVLRRCLAAHQDRTRAEAETGAEAGAEAGAGVAVAQDTSGTLRAERADRPFDCVVIDTPPTTGASLLIAFAAAHRVLVPFQPHFLAAEGIRQLSRLYYYVATRYGPRLDGFAILPVMYDARLRMHRMVMADVERQFGRHRLLRGIRADVKLAESFGAGQPIQLFCPRSRGGLDYHLLAEDLALAWPGAPTPTPTPTPLSMGATALAGSDAADASARSPSTTPSPLPCSSAPTEGESS